MADLLELVKLDLARSCIDDETARLNFEPVNGLDAFDILYGDSAKRINSGRLNSSWLRKYYAMEEFLGWHCNGRVKWLGGSPILDKAGDPIRYMTPLGGEVAITFIKPSGRAIALAEARFNCPKPSELKYWDWVIRWGLSVVITEGEKKAAALICAGIPAISLPGIYTGYACKRDDWGAVIERKLRSALAPFDTAGRQICIIFDNRPDVEFEATPEFKAAAILSRQFKESRVTIAQLRGQHKGADDFLVAGEYHEIQRAIDTAKPAAQYEHLKLWKSYRTFDESGMKTADFFFTAPDPESNTITVIKSNLNSGKSEWLAKQVAKVEAIKFKGKTKYKSHAKGVKVSLGHRNSLQEQLCQRWDFDHLDLHAAYNRFNDPNLQVALCFDSLLKLPPEIFPGSTVIVDETMTAIKHLLSSNTLRGKRLEVIRRFEYIVKVCDRLILMDGNMADWMVDYVREVDPGKLVKIYDNKSERPTPPIFFVDDSDITRKQAEEWINLQILESDLPAVVVDSIIKCEAIAEQLQKLRGDGLLITSKTVTEKWAREFLADPDEYIAANPTRVNWIACTPTVESGVSINADRFDTVFCWFVGVIGINEAVQMSRRVRNPQRIIVYAPKVGIDNKRNAGALENLLMEDLEIRIAAEAGLFANETIADKIEKTMKSQLASASVHAWAKMQAINFLETRNYRDFLFLAFESMGMNPKRIEAFAIDSEAYRSAKLEVQIIECTQIFNAPDLTEIEADALSKKLDANWHERCSVLKYKILYRLPGLSESPLWSPDFIHRLRYRERALNSQLELYWLLTHPEASRALQAHKWRDKDDIDFFIPDRVGEDRWLFVEALNRLGFPKFLDGRRYSDQSEDVIEFVGTIRRKKTISAITGHPGSLRNLAFVNRTLLQTAFGIKPQKLQIRLPPPLPGIEGKRLYVYWYDRAKSHTDNFEELIQFTERRFLTRLDAINAPADTDGEATEHNQEPILSQPQIEDFYPDEAQNPYPEGVVSNDAILLQTKDNNEICPIESDPTVANRHIESGMPTDAHNSANRGELIPQAGDRSIIESKGDEEAHKPHDSDLLTVWVRSRLDNRPTYEAATLLNCDFEDFQVVIDGAIFDIPACDLYWEQPVPT